MEEEPSSPIKKLRSPLLDKTFNSKTSITCTQVPESLFESKAAEKHFSKFGRVHRIRLLPKKHMCLVEYDQQVSAERAVLNAGAFDGFMFDVTRTKPRVRRKSKKDDDPEWLPDPEVKAELSAMVGAPSYKITRQKSMDFEVQRRQPLELRPPIRKKTILATPKRVKPVAVKQPVSGIESPVLVTTVPTSLTTTEAALELHKLRAKVSLTPDEKWRALDARDRILRAWGGAGSRVKVGGATIGTCPDMCPEKELLHRMAEHQVMTLETVVDSDGLLEPWRAVKQYSRSSADQEIPMCYELRPANVLMRTCAYLIVEIADTTRQVTLADWFHFMWDRFRGIRKDITQQALCCAESIRLVEICARFHAHCAARLADLEHTQFDQKLNTDNLTKCLQTLKHMYADVGPQYKPNEAEFRGYVALLNLGDANFWWEIKQLPQAIQKSDSITFAIQIYITLDNNNYVKFFRLIREKASYLQACILLRYFNDVRARALARIVKAYAPRGGSRYPAEDLMKTLAFESVESMKLFISHYGLRFSKSDTELTVILNRNHFIEDSDPYPLSRAISLIESKRQNTIGAMISGGQLPVYNYGKLTLHSSFNTDGRVKETALIAEDLGYNTLNDSNKNVQALKAELHKLSQGRKMYENVESIVDQSKIVFAKADDCHKKYSNVFATTKNLASHTKQFAFQPAIPVAPTEVIKNSPEKVLKETSKNIFFFSKPQKSDPNALSKNVENDLGKTKPLISSGLVSNGKNVFRNTLQSGKTLNVVKKTFAMSQPSDVFKTGTFGKSIFGHQIEQSQNKNTEQSNKAIFGANTNLFSQTSSIKNIFTQVGNNLFSNTNDKIKTANIFTKSLDLKQQSNNFKQQETPHVDPQHVINDSSNKNFVFQSNGETAPKVSPSSLFKSANQPSFETNYTIFQTKNKVPTVADNIYNSVNSKHDIYDFDNNDQDTTSRLSCVVLPRVVEQEIEDEEQRRQEETERLEKEKIELQRREEEKRKQEVLRQEELRQFEEKKRQEEQKRLEKLRRKLEEEKAKELKRKAEEHERLFKKRVEKESIELIDQLITEVSDETVQIILNEEIESLRKLYSYANELTENIIVELTSEISHSEMIAELHRTKKLMRKWYHIWRKQFMRNFKRRSLLEDTPVWLSDNTPQVEARFLRRSTEESALRNMNAIHRGYRFVGELKQIPSPNPYNIVDLIRSRLLKRMKQIEYPYNKCFFWKVALVTLSGTSWLYRKINLEKWIHDVFSDNQNHDTSESLIYVGKQSWNNLIDFAVSISLIKSDNFCVANEALNGANGIIYFATENDINHIEVIEQTLKYKYQYQVVPITVIMAASHEQLLQNVCDKLIAFKNNNVISDFKIYTIEPVNIENSIDACTKSALKWLAKNSPKPPSLEIDYLKSICQQYLGNEIWHRLRSEKDKRTQPVLKNLQNLVVYYNEAVDKLTQIITNENLFNYPSFPLEFRQYLDRMSPYPKPYEFITSNVKHSDNIRTIRNIMKTMKLPNPKFNFLPNNVSDMQEQIRKYCNQLGWGTDPEEVVCKVVALLPNELSDVTMPCEKFNEYFNDYDLIDLLNVIVYEKINSLKNFNNTFAIYEKSVLNEYRNLNWLFEMEFYSKAKHKILEYEDDLDVFIETKRRRLDCDSFENLILEDKDYTLIEQSLQMADKSMSTYDTCKNAVSELEQQLNLEKKKSDELENILRIALSNV